MAFATFVAIFAALFGCASARYDIKNNLQSGYEASYARLQELAQQALKNLAEDPEVSTADRMAQEAKTMIPATADGWKAPPQPWLIDIPKLEHIDEINFAFPGDDSLDLVTPPQRATLTWEKDGCPPSKGWPALITIPGRKNRRSTMQYVADLLAGKGRMTLNIDMKDDARLKDLNMAIAHMKANNLTYNVNPDDIAVFGYSLGAITLATAMHKDYVANQLSAVIVTSGASLGHVKGKMGLTWEEGKYKFESGPNAGKFHAPPSLIIHCTDDGLVPYFAKKMQVPEEFVKNMQMAGLVSHGLFYDNGCYHHPFKNLGFFDQIDLFLKDPIKYESEIYADPAQYKAMMDNYVPISTTHGCAYNDEGIEPFRALEMFNQMDVCKAACYQAEGCVAFDWYSAFAYERPTGKENCFLYKQPCEIPLYDVCTDKRKCPQSMKMLQPPSVFDFYGSSLAQVAAKPALIQRHQSLRGGGYADSHLKRVRTTSMCEIDETANVTVATEGQKGLFTTLQAVDSVGCDFVFTEFGQGCHEIDGEPMHLKNALECAQASARLEGYTFSGEVESEDSHRFPHGCFLQENTGLVKFNPFDVTLVDSSHFAIACQRSTVFLEPTNEQLKNYNRTLGDTTWVSYCAGEYQLGVFDTLNFTECAEKCDAIAACTHFKFCSFPKKDCCQLSSTCTTPYKNASADWDGYLKLAPPTVDTALTKFEKTEGGGCGLEEYVLDSFSIDDPATCAKKCEELNSCNAFTICSSPDDIFDGGQCCRLSSSCSMPYTKSFPGWDGYMSKQTLEKTSGALSMFIKTNGSNQVNSYCTGLYNLAMFTLRSPDECAAKCFANKECTHFKLCKGDEELCCQLSSLCALPYTSASEAWDGYLNKELSSTQAAAASLPVASESETFEKEPLCSSRAAPISLTDVPYSVNTSGGFEMMFFGVAEVEGEAVDLLITSEGGEYHQGRGSNYRAGNIGVINVALGTGVDLTFKFQSASQECVAFDEIHFTVLEMNKKSDTNMDMTWEFSDIGGFVVKPDSLVDVTTAEEKTIMTAKSTGFCSDAPVDPFNLTEAECWGGWVSYEQEKRAAMVVYKRTCEFKAKLFAPGETFAYGWPFFFTFSSELAELCS